jgi:hypothetical protein
VHSNPAELDEEDDDGSSTVPIERGAQRCVQRGDLCWACSVVRMQRRRNRRDGEAAPRRHDCNGQNHLRHDCEEARADERFLRPTVQRASALPQRSARNRRHDDGESEEDPQRRRHRRS